jgi:hypothetical protein
VEALDLLRIEETKVMNRGKLPQHPGTSGVVEGSRDVLIPVAQ